MLSHSTLEDYILKRFLGGLLLGVWNDVVGTNRRSHLLLPPCWVEEVVVWKGKYIFVQVVDTEYSQLKEASPDPFDPAILAQEEEVPVIISYQQFAYFEGRAEGMDLN